MKASALVGLNKRTKISTDKWGIESSSDNEQDDEDVMMGDETSEANITSDNGGDDTEEEGGYEQMREDANQDRKVSSSCLVFRS